LTSRLNVVPLVICDPETENYQEILALGNCGAMSDCARRRSKHVTREIFALREVLQPGIHVGRIDDDDPALLPVRLE
jgi:hypothetical protein